MDSRESTTVATGGGVIAVLSVSNVVAAETALLAQNLLNAEDDS